jgi:hypothetical protein
MLTLVLTVATHVYVYGLMHCCVCQSALVLALLSSHCRYYYCRAVLECGAVAIVMVVCM